jgi:hypothetical protein
MLVPGLGRMLLVENHNPFSKILVFGIHNDALLVTIGIRATIRLTLLWS